MRWSYRAFLNWGAEPGSDILESTRDWMCTARGGMTIGKLALCRQCWFPERGLSRRDCEAVCSTLPSLVDSPNAGGGQRHGQEHTKKSTPSAFLESPVPEHPVITSSPRMPSNVDLWLKHFEELASKP